MRQHKPAHVDRPAQPSFTVLGSLLGERTGTGPATGKATAQLTSPE
jgi:hypothetical protein